VFRAGVQVIEVEQEELEKVEDDPDVEIGLPGIPIQEQFIPKPSQVGEENADLDESQI
jgi:hypothetical protein